MTKKELGAWGETKAIEYLTKIGYTLLAKNFQIKEGEVDLIMQNPDQNISLIEIKTRQIDTLETPTEKDYAASAEELSTSLNKAKVTKILKAGLAWQDKNKSNKTISVEFLIVFKTHKDTYFQHIPDIDV